jgi:hypothetical protein
MVMVYICTSRGRTCLCPGSNVVTAIVYGTLLHCSLLDLPYKDGRLFF